MANKLSQKAGENSQQYQIENYNIGMSQEEIMNYISKENELVIANCNIIARDVALERLNQYTETLLPKLVRAEILSAFSEPSFQFAYKASEKTAVCTDRKADYEMLSELLIHKFENKLDFTVSASIEKAIQEVNNISEEALMTLTVLYSIITYVPKSSIASEGMTALEVLYEKLLKNFTLPQTRDWVDNLDVVNAIRVTNIAKSKKMEDYFCEKFQDYTKRGIKKDSEKYAEIIEKIKAVKLPLGLLIINELDPEYVRLCILRKEEIEDLRIIINDGPNKKEIELSNDQKELVNYIFDSYDGTTEVTKSKFKEMMYSKPNFNTIIKWWDKVMTEFSINITPIGNVLACTNARRIDSTLPPLKK